MRFTVTDTSSSEGASVLEKCTRRRQEPSKDRLFLDDKQGDAVLVGIVLPAALLLSSESTGEGCGTSKPLRLSGGALRIRLLLLFMRKENLTVIAMLVASLLLFQEMSE